MTHRPKIFNVYFNTKNYEESIIYLDVWICTLVHSERQAPDTLHFNRLTLTGPGDDGGNEYPRTPETVPTVAIDGHTLYIISGCDNTTLSLVDEDDDEAYSTTILEGTTLLVLPEWLQGTYELRILRGQYMYYAEIEL